MDFYSVAGSIIFFGLAVPAGYFLCARFAHKETLAFFFSRATEIEAARRDRLFLPLTRRMKRISPNTVTYLGFLLIAALACLFWIGVPVEVIFVGILLAGFTDMLDGPLARNNDRVTVLGAKLDWIRDLSMSIVIGIALVVYHILAVEFLLWFLISWGILGLLRMAEFKLSNGTLLNTDEDEDYKFILDRVRLLLMWVAVMFLVFAPYHAVLGIVGNVLAATSIVVAWFAVLLHAAHLKLLRMAKVKI
ncbi:CDP-alcohol phosphatidyltransferase family protein [Candidatus Kaiserbacteria bacterium]|nr:CDP-alcohol phosphatidyltransferase family protein [Candidatus Kaiserbacteria bacterium]